MEDKHYVAIIKLNIIESLINNSSKTIIQVRAQGQGECIV